MNFENCKLYKLNRKRDLYRLLGVANSNSVSTSRKQYNVRIEDGKRLIESPTLELKLIQKRILKLLYGIEFDNYVFSGIKGRCAHDNAQYHLDSSEMLKLDMRKFFPNTIREKVYSFFYKELKMASDVAKLCTDITTVDYNLLKLKEDVEEFLIEKNIRNRNHLPSGTPTSQILSYLANINMFDELNRFSVKHQLKMSIYVDDLTFSCSRGKIYNKYLIQIARIIRKHGYRISMNKTKKYDKNDYKKITGFVISPQNTLLVPNKIRKKIKDITCNDYVKIYSQKEINSLNGLINFAQLSKKTSYKELKRTIEQKHKNSV